MRILILGGANTVWEDAAKAQELATFDVTIAVNDIGTVWEGRLDHWVSLHPDQFNKWMNARAEKGLNDDYKTWAHKLEVPRSKPQPRLDAAMKDWGGSSGLLAVRIALAIGGTRIVLAGIPMSANAAHYFDPKPWGTAMSHRKAWQTHQAEMAPFVRSMSGWTQALLGEPTQSWLTDAK